MSQDERNTPKERRPRRDRFEFYYWERVSDRHGDRYYLRITRFSLYLMIGLAVVMMPFLLMDSGGGDGPNIRITPRDESRDITVPRQEVPHAPASPTPWGQGTGAKAPALRRSPSPSRAPAETSVMPPGFEPTPQPTPTVRRSPSPVNTDAAPTPSPRGNANE